MEPLRKGIMSMGTWLVDSVKFISKYPSAGNLVSIERVETGLGGCSHNVLVDLARMQAGIPLYAGGCVGNDPDGDYILSEIKRYRIDASFMYRLDHIPTSYTDVMSETAGTSRTFFHNRGANACLSPDHFAGVNVAARIFHLGYLLLLDKLDAEDPDYGIVAARVLDTLQQKGYKTSVDVVSEESDRFCKVIIPCLPFINYLIVNEVEAGACFGKSLRDSEGKILLQEVEQAARFLMDEGVRNVCAIHFPEGGYALDRQGESVFEPSLQLTSSEIVSTVGAGDAFCAGMLYALHENMELEKAVRLANTSARFNLRHATCTGGAPSLSEIKKFMELNYKGDEKE